jgi:long-chain acyl-CoA synthetase
MSMTLSSILAESALRYPDREAVILGDSRITYAQLWDETRRYAAVLREQGVGPGDTVALLMPNVPDFPRVYYAALSLGAVVVPVHALLVAPEIAYVLRDSGAKVLVALAVSGAMPSPIRAGNVRSVPPPATAFIAPATADTSTTATRCRVGFTWGSSR